MQFESFLWLSHHGLWFIIPCSANMVNKRVIFWTFLLRSSKNAFIMQSKSTFLEFLRGIHRYKFGHPRGEIIQGEWRNFPQACALFLTGVEFHVLPCVLVCFLEEFDLLFAFSVLSSLSNSGLCFLVYLCSRTGSPMFSDVNRGSICIWLHLLT